MNDNVNMVEEAALSIFKTRDAVYRFMTTPHVLLEDKTPAEVIASGDNGAKEVIDLLRRSLAGVAI